MSSFWNEESASLTERISAKEVFVGPEGMCDSSTHVITQVRTSLRNSVVGF